jgi:hypothetical protein
LPRFRFDLIFLQLPAYGQEEQPLQPFPCRRIYHIASPSSAAMTAMSA